MRPEVGANRPAVAPSVPRAIPKPTAIANRVSTITAMKGSSNGARSRLGSRIAALMKNIGKPTRLVRPATTMPLTRRPVRRAPKYPADAKMKASSSDTPGAGTREGFHPPGKGNDNNRSATVAITNGHTTRQTMLSVCLMYQASAPSRPSDGCLASRYSSIRSPGTESMSDGLSTVRKSALAQRGGLACVSIMYAPLVATSCHATACPWPSSPGSTHGSPHRSPKSSAGQGRVA